jgi:hypothetical protein
MFLYYLTKMNVEDNKAELDQKLKRNEEEHHRMFNLGERIVTEYMSFLMTVGEDTKNTITNETLFNEMESLERDQIPLIIHPIPTYGERCLKFSLQIVDHDYRCQIPPQLLENRQIQYIMGFIYHSVISCYTAILKTNIRDDMVPIVTEKSINLEMDDATLTFFPSYIYPDRRKELMLKEVKGNYEKEIEKFNERVTGADKVNLTKEIVEELAALKEKYTGLDKYLQTITYDREEADKIESVINAFYKTTKRIGIVFEEVDI